MMRLAAIRIDGDVPNDRSSVRHVESSPLVAYAGQQVDAWRRRSSRQGRVVCCHVALTRLAAGASQWFEEAAWSDFSIDGCSSRRVAYAADVDPLDCSDNT